MSAWTVREVVEGSAAFDKGVGSVMENFGYTVRLLNPRLCYSESERVGMWRSGHAVKR